MRHFTLNVRLTKKCNADCSYCSSWTEDHEGRMRPEQYQQSLHFLLEHYFPKIGVFAPGESNHLSVQYVGGEILTIPTNELRDSVLMARSLLSSKFDQMVDGVQTNLIGGWSKVRSLVNLFGDRLSTSVDNHTQSRTFAGSSDRYREIYSINEQTLIKKRLTPPAILVVDKLSAPFLKDEILTADSKKQNLTLRAVFSGGKDITGTDLSQEEISEIYAAEFDKWVMTSSILIEPFSRLLSGVISEKHNHKNNPYGACSGCPFQSNCAQVSLDLEPNGDLYLCLDTADSGQLCLGNALEGIIHWDVWEMINDRTGHLSSECKKCPWKSVCHGGCMSEAITHGFGAHGRTVFCGVWKTLFSRIELAVDHYGCEAIYDWMESIRLNN